MHVMFEAGEMVLEPPVRNEQMLNSAVIMRSYLIQIASGVHTRYAPPRSVPKRQDPVRAIFNDNGEVIGVVVHKDERSDFR